MKKMCDGTETIQSRMTSLIFTGITIIFHFEVIRRKNERTVLDCTYQRSYHQDLSCRGSRDRVCKKAGNDKRNQS